MKRWLILMLAACLMLAAGCSAPADAGETEQTPAAADPTAEPTPETVKRPTFVGAILSEESNDQWEYTICEKGNGVKKYLGIETELVLPEEFEGGLLLYISSGTFAGNETLTSISLPEGLLRVDTEAFLGCSALSTMNLPSTLVKLEASAFEGCTGLTSVTVPGGVSILGSRAFADCTGLQAVVLQEGTTSIQDGAFSGCTALQSIVIPASVTAIGTDVFAGCPEELVLSGPAGSFAETYAKEQNIAFQAS